ncbi:hypothetical protein DFH09DRAFT_1335193 [Mycena vulgaris]|nr:hypothetical protein DFH09DRAFT_1335193 [Mycena vulgaris]
MPTDSGPVWSPPASFWHWHQPRSIAGHRLGKASATCGRAHLPPLPTSPSPFHSGDAALHAPGKKILVVLRLRNVRPTLPSCQRRARAPRADGRPGMLSNLAPTLVRSCRRASGRMLEVSETAYIHYYLLIRVYLGNPSTISRPQARRPSDTDSYLATSLTASATCYRGPSARGVGQRISLPLACGHIHAEDACMMAHPPVLRPAAADSPRLRGMA